MKSVKDFDIAGKRVLIRCDFNVPLSEDGEVLDDFRIKKTIPTISYLLEQNAKIILMSHLGRPAQTQNPKLKTQSLTLKSISKRLTELLGREVKFLDDCLGESVEKEITIMQSGEILLLENLRFYKEEEENNENFAKELAKLGDIYINDAFGASHRAHASIVGITKFLPAGAGLLLEKEVGFLSNLIESPQKPLIAIIGGKKVEDKVKVINRISAAADFVLISGLIQKEIKEKNIQLKYPQKIIGPVDEIGDGKDIGPETVDLFKEKIASAKTIFWSGPLGLIEEEEFSKGSEAIARAIIKSGASSVVGGGETVEFVNRLGLGEKFSHLSTGGGAMLEFLSGEKLPGLEVLK